MGTGAGFLLTAFLVAAPPDPLAAGHAHPIDSLTVRYFAKIYLLPSEDAPLIGIGEDGRRLPVFARKGAWAQIGFHRITGWTRMEPAAGEERPEEAGVSNGKVTLKEANPPDPGTRAVSARPGLPPPAMLWGKAMGLILACASAALLAGLAILRMRRRPSGRTVPAARDGRDLLLVASCRKIIEGHPAGAVLPLDRCLADLGFEVDYADTFARCAARFKRGEVPSVLGVDARLGPKAVSAAMDLCRRAPRAPALIFFYNSEDPEAIRPPADLPQVHFLNGRFSSRHVMELLAPLYHTRPSMPGEEPATAGPGSLEGRIGPGGLCDILQFLEVGRRSGMLSIEDGLPAGVVNFENGVITFAQTRGAAGLEAVLEILSQTRGDFRFYADKRIDQGNCRLSAFEVALRWAHRQDETVKMAAQVRPETSWAPGTAEP